MKRLDNKVAIVTGAGSRGPGLGNGKATAILFAREGARVLCVDLAKDRADETVGLIRAEGGEAEAFAADVTVAAQCRAMVEAAVGRWGGLDVLHNNVGIESRHGLIDDHREEWDRVMAVDLKSMLLATQAAVPAHGARGGGVDHLRLLGRRPPRLRPHRLRRRQGRRHRLRQARRRAARPEGHPRQRHRARDRLDADGRGPRRPRRASAGGGLARSAPRAPAGTSAGARSTWRATSRAG